MDEFFTPFFNDLTQQAIRVIPGPVPHLELVGQCIIDYQYRQNDKIAQANVNDRGDMNANKRVIPHVNTQPAHSLEVPKPGISFPENRTNFIQQATQSLDSGDVSTEQRRA